MPATAPLDRAYAGTINWLLEPENPTVRFLTLTALLGRSLRHPETREAHASIMRTGVVPAILARQDAGGHWGKPDSFYTAKYRGTVWQLIILAEHFADGRDARVRRACEFVLTNSQDPSGGFSQQRAKGSPGGLPSGVIPCLTGNLVWSLLRLGYLGDERVDRGVEWLTRFLRFDDGDSAPPHDWPYNRWEMCYGRHTCFMGVVKGLKALAAIPADRRSAAVRRTIQAGAEFLLRHHVFKRSHDLGRLAKPGWTRLGFPRMYQTDVLEIALLLLELDYRDERLKEAIDLVRSRCGPDGRWVLQDTFNGKFQVDIEQKGKPSKWTTLNALRVLKGAGVLGASGVSALAARPSPPATLARENASHRQGAQSLAGERVPAILAELRGMGSERDRAGMARYGINVENAFGVSVYELRKIAKRLGTDHDLALALWATGNHEARLLACFVDDPAAVTAEQAEAWASDFDSWDICDQATTSLLDLTRHAWSKTVEWAERDEEWIKRAGFALVAGLAVHDKSAADRAFMKLLPVIERGASDDRNFVKKAVNWALRNIGKRNRALNDAAVACARRILAAANERAGGERGGDPGCRAARWVASDAIRELTSEKVQARLKGA
jgi:3-methyladenine DNA glycosylase AlkD